MSRPTHNYISRTTIKSMKAAGLAAGQEGGWRNIAIALIDGRSVLSLKETAELWHEIVPCTVNLRKIKTKTAIQ